MKILRTRRGFTTNSSSASEWSSTSGSSSSSGSQSSTAPSGSSTPLPVGAVVEIPPARASQPSSPAFGFKVTDALSIVGLAAIVGGLVVGDRVLRKWLVRKRGEKE